MITVLVLLVANHHLLRTVTVMIIMLINPCIKNQLQEWMWLERNSKGGA
jgi:hypothetical protein